MHINFPYHKLHGPCHSRLHYTLANKYWKQTLSRSIDYFSSFPHRFCALNFRWFSFQINICRHTVMLGLELEQQDCFLLQYYTSTVLTLHWHILEFDFWSFCNAKMDSKISSELQASITNSTWFQSNRPSRFVPRSTMSRDIVEWGTNWLGV